MACTNALVEPGVRPKVLYHTDKGKILCVGFTFVTKNCEQKFKRQMRTRKKHKQKGFYMSNYILFFKQEAKRSKRTSLMLR